MPQWQQPHHFVLPSNSYSISPHKHRPTVLSAAVLDEVIQFKQSAGWEMKKCKIQIQIKLSFLHTDKSLFIWHSSHMNWNFKRFQVNWFAIQQNTLRTLWRVDQQHLWQATTIVGANERSCNHRTRCDRCRIERCTDSKVLQQHSCKKKKKQINNEPQKTKTTFTWVDWLERFLYQFSNQTC